MAYGCVLDYKQECYGCGICTPEEEPEEETAKENCGTCSWKTYDEEIAEIVCMNVESNYYLDIINDKHSCADYEKEGEE